MEYGNLTDKIVWSRENTVGYAVVVDGVRAAKPSWVPAPILEKEGDKKNKKK